MRNSFNSFVCCDENKEVVSNAQPGGFGGPPPGTHTGDIKENIPPVHMTAAEKRAAEKAEKRARKEAHTLTLAEAAKPTNGERVANVLELAAGTAVVVGGIILVCRYGLGLGRKAAAIVVTDVTPEVAPEMHNQ